VNGSKLPHVVAGDYDHYDPADENPPGVEILAQSPVETSYGHADVADMTYYTDRTSGAGVIATGTIGWIPSLGTSHNVTLITENILRLFGAGPAAGTQPSVADWRRFR
jgi:hypothetical protein